MRPSRNASSRTEEGGKQRKKLTILLIVSRSVNVLA